MSGVRIEAIEHPRDTVRFVRCWWRVFRDDPHWVPPLIFERKRFFHPEKNPYFKVADLQCFMAYRDGEALGTIAATVDHLYQKVEADVGFFGFFEFVDDLEVARTLFDAACGWLRDRGMKKVVGPFNLNSNHEFGLLVDGFDTDPYVANPHNSAYFPPIYERLGLKKAMDWYAYCGKFDNGPQIQRIRKVVKRFEDRHPELQIRHLDMKNYDAEVRSLHAIYDDAWEQNWSHVRVTKEEFYHIAQGLKTLIDPTLCFVVEMNGDVVGISVTLPDFNRIVKKLDGRILPFGWLRFLIGRRKIDAARIFMLGIKKDFQHLPLGASLYVKTWDRAIELGYREGEASLILETNTRMRRALERLDATIYKTYRSYEYLLDESNV